MVNIVAITSEPDHHIEMVNHHLDEPIYVIDPREIAVHTAISYGLDNTGFHVRVGGMPLEEVVSVWYRRPKYLSGDDFVKLGIDPEYIGLSESAYLDSVKSMYGILRDKLWVSDVANIARVGNKLLQLEIAQELGFDVPRTLITSNPNDAEQFKLEHGTIITKPIGNFVQRKDDGNYTLFTTRLGPQDEVDFSGLEFSPAMFQECIQKVSDVRVIVIGNQVFACTINYDDQEGQQPDWRLAQGTDSIKYSTHVLPRNIANISRKLVKTLGLEFGAIDLAIDNQGRYIFFEINPNGQWGFVEYATGMPLSATMAEMLQKGTRTYRHS